MQQLKPLRQEGPQEYNLRTDSDLPWWPVVKRCWRSRASVRIKARTGSDLLIVVGKGLMNHQELIITMSMSRGTPMKLERR